MKKFFLFAFIFLSVGLFSQDTIKVMQYNLLYYGEPTDWCDNANNNISDKDEYLKTILAYVQPDIFTVNELSKSVSIHQHLLDKVLNDGETDKYQKANFLKEAESDIVNMLFYNTEKLALHSHFIAQNYIRDIDVYKLYHLSESTTRGDTAFIICVVAHLKSSTGSDNEAKRKQMADNTMAWIEAFDDDNNYLMMGDFNLYSPTEPAYQAFVNNENPSIRFSDPVDQNGEWHNNAAYSPVHTQSTHTESSGCAATGGMDDRFDFILISNPIKQGSKKVKYVDGSYWAVGQDGNHFNQSLIDQPANTSVSSSVLNALYNMSDHLPVTLKLVVDDELSAGGNKLENIDVLIIANPVNEMLTIKINALKKTKLTLEIFNMSGQLQLTQKNILVDGSSELNIAVNTLISGTYLVKFSDKNKGSLTKKMIKY